MNWLHELSISLLVSILYLGLFVGVEAWSRRRGTDVEFTRKAVHVGAGLIALPFPWIFQSAWTVVALAVPFVSLLIYARRTGVLGSVQGIERISIGEVLYPIAVASTLLIATSATSPYLYVCAILTLAVSDALAGLIGRSFGRRLFRVFGGTKSVEGSMVFLTTAFLISWLMLSLMAGWPLPAAITAALLCSAAATVIEAVSPNGFDNLGIPLVVLAVLLHQAPTPSIL